eukprot:TRINITY_DN40350_c0_g1_i1.p1 TRINITY_DN40350_c0_g1~~TRINITY_DN40350_c0_g1_i1.p1  ORF type:complete len:160 (+),score=20.87 TRINITY_DN40350_c0_g1_i1:28-507(+)
MVQRLTLRRRLSYNTNSNKRQIIKTPGGKLVYHYLKKRGTLPKCGDCHEKLHGIQPSRPFQRRNMPRRLKTVTRAYGGSRCHKCVRQRILRAFLIEEQKIVIKVLKAQQKSQKAAEKAPAKAKATAKKDTGKGAQKGKAAQKASTKAPAKATSKGPKAK